PCACSNSKRARASALPRVDHRAVGVSAAHDLAPGGEYIEGALDGFPRNRGECRRQPELQHSVHRIGRVGMCVEITSYFTCDSFDPGCIGHGERPARPLRRAPGACEASAVPDANTLIARKAALRAGSK